MNSVFIVIAGVEYEGSNAVKAFELRAEADAFRDACGAYQQTQPSTPELGDTPGNDVEWEEWAKADTVWRDAHPAGEDNTSSEYYLVQEIPFVKGKSE